MAGKQQTIRLRNNIAEAFSILDSYSIIDERCFSDKEREELKGELFKIIKKIDTKMMNL